jgi:hypothetical protein
MVPVGEVGARGGVDEQEVERPEGQLRRAEERLGRGVGGEDLETGVDDVCGGVWEGVHELEQLGADRSGRRLGGGCELREAEGVLAGVRAESQGGAQGVDDLRRRGAFAPLFEPGVVVGADAGEHGDLLAPQAVDPPRAEVGQADVGGREARALGAEELAERAR